MAGSAHKDPNLEARLAQLRQGLGDEQDLEEDAEDGSGHDLKVQVRLRIFSEP